MSRFARKERPPRGFEILEPTLNALENELRESEYALQEWACHLQPTTDGVYRCLLVTCTVIKLIQGKLLRLRTVKLGRLIVDCDVQLLTEIGAASPYCCASRLNLIAVLRIGTAAAGAGTSSPS